MKRQIAFSRCQTVSPALSPDGRLLACEIHEIDRKSKFIVIVETHTGREIARRRSDFARDLRFLPDNQTLAITQSGYMQSEPVKLWQVRT